MEREEMIARLIRGIEECDAMNGTHVYVSRQDAETLVRILSGESGIAVPPRDGGVQRLFYCADCGRSFRVKDPKEEPGCFEKWQYHAWLAECPACHRTVRQTDRYWR